MEIELSIAKNLARATKCFYHVFFISHSTTIYSYINFSPLDYHRLGKRRFKSTFIQTLNPSRAARGAFRRYLDNGRWVLRSKTVIWSPRLCTFISVSLNKIQSTAAQKRQDECWYWMIFLDGIWYMYEVQLNWNKYKQS